LEYYTRQ
jgi:hypothetical protein